MIELTVNQAEEQQVQLDGTVIDLFVVRMTMTDSSQSGWVAKVEGPDEEMRFQRDFVASYWEGDEVGSSREVPIQDGEVIEVAPDSDGDDEREYYQFDAERETERLQRIEAGDVLEAVEEVIVRDGE